MRAWTVWVPEDDREAAALLEAAGHQLDATPAAMLLDLAGLPDPDPQGLDWDGRAAPADVARINDLAYGFERPTFGAALTALPADVPLRLYQARVDGEPVSVLGTIDDGDDCGIYLVATLKGHRGNGPLPPPPAPGARRGARARPAHLEPAGDQARPAGLRAAGLRGDLHARDVGASKALVPSPADMFPACHGPTATRSSTRRSRP